MGRFKRILVVDSEAEVVVQRIFDEYIKCVGFRAIAHADDAAKRGQLVDPAHATSIND